MDYAPRASTHLPPPSSWCLGPTVEQQRSFAQIAKQTDGTFAVRMMPSWKDRTGRLVHLIRLLRL